MMDWKLKFKFFLLCSDKINSTRSSVSGRGIRTLFETSNFKSYDDLKEKLNRVISGSKNTETASEIDLPPTTGGTAAATATASVKSNEASSVYEDDDTLSYFSKLAEDE